jgi:hypothetical protein
MLFISFTACNEDLITGNLDNESDEFSENNEVVTSENVNITLDVARKIAMQNYVREKTMRFKKQNVSLKIMIL